MIDKLSMAHAKPVILWGALILPGHKRTFCCKPGELTRKGPSRHRDYMWAPGIPAQYAVTEGPGPGTEALPPLYGGESVEFEVATGIARSD